MDLPPDLIKLIQQNLEAVRQDPKHNLTYDDMFRIYDSFGPSRLHLPEYSKRGQEFNFAEHDEWVKNRFLNFTIADYAQCWLAVLTARKVEFICKRVLKLPYFILSEDAATIPPRETEVDEVREILNTSEAVLNKRMTFEEGKEVLDDHWYFNRPKITYDIYCAWVSAMDALTVIIHGPGIRGEFSCNAGNASEAYSVIDHNLLGEGELPDPPIPLEYDLKKRLEFWEWWLTEAIPQAWELAHHNMPNETHN